MPAGSNPVFTPPDDPNAKLWRYMDFTKFISLLELSSLYFSRADLLGDLFEGSFGKENIRLRPELYPGMTADQLERMADIHSKFLYCTYINCWHANEYESAAMWKLYARTNEAIAIQTTYARLHEALPSNCFIGKVAYEDYEKVVIDEKNAFSPFLCKRHSFAHEHEVRAIKAIHQVEGNTIMLDIQGPPGDPVAIADLNAFLTGIFVAPTAPNWFFELTERLAKKYGLTAPVTRSSLDASPVY